MKKEDVIKQLIPGLILGFFLGCILIYFVGVDNEKLVPNIIGAIMSCAVPTLLNGLIVLKGTAKTLDRKLSIGKAFVMNIPYIIIGGIIGFLFIRIVIMMILGLDPCDFNIVAHTLTYAIFGAITSTILAFIALKQYVKAVKYTKR